MAGRPQKHTVDYFPHYTKSGKTLFILESRYRNDGYAFWFKLLEILSASENHILDIRNTADLQYLLAKTLVDETTGLGILKLLSELDAIDPTLWAKKIIWVQKLVDNFADIYKKRSQELPIKPIVVGDNAISDNDNAISDNINTQSKVKESKVKESKEYIEVIPEWIDKDIWLSFLEVRKKQRAVPTDRAKELLFKELEKLKSSGNDPNEVLNQSIMNNWKGVFALRNNGGKDGRVYGQVAAGNEKPTGIRIIE